MARLPRLAVAGEVHHLLQRARADVPAFVDASERERFIELLHNAALEHTVAVHAYALLDGEVQLMATPARTDGLGRLLQAVSRRYVPYVNRSRGRSGALWHGRFRAAPLADDVLLDSMRAIEQAPRRDGWERPLADFAWSSAAVHVGRSPPRWLAPVPAESGYWRLGNTPFERDAAYAAILEEPLAPAVAAHLARALSGNWAVGSRPWTTELERDGARRALPRVRGRRKASERGNE